MAAVLGNLKVLLGIDSAAIAGDMGKVRATVAAGVADMRTRSAGAMKALSTEIAGVGGAVRGAQQATGIAMRSLELMGEKGSAAVAGIGNAVASLAAGGFTPLGLAMAGVTAGIALLTSQKSDLASTFQVTEEKARAAAESVARLRAERDLLFAGRGTGSSAVDIAVAEAESRRLDLVSQQNPDGAWSRLGSAMSLGLWKTEAQSAKEAAGLTDRYLSSIYEKESLSAEMAATRKEREEKIAELKKKQAEAAEKAVEADRKALDVTRARLDAAMSGGRGVEEKELDLKLMRNEWMNPAIERARLRLRWAEEDVGIARSKGASDHELVMYEQRVRFAQRELAIVEEIEDEKEARAERERADAESRSDAELAMLEIVREQREEYERIHEITSDPANPNSPKQQEQVRKWREEEEDLAERIRRVDAERVGFLRDAARQDNSFGGGFMDRVGEIRQWDASFRALGATMADLGTHGLAGGLTNALEDVARGARSAGEAFRQFASDAVLAFGRAITQAMILRAVTAAFGGAAAPSALDKSVSWELSHTADGRAIPGAAHGGTWRVSGLGGLDSAMVRMKLSPGELVKVSDGANAGGGGGGFYGTLVVRPPAVIADEVMARSSPAARAAVVATAMARPGRRGARARD